MFFHDCIFILSDSVITTMILKCFQIFHSVSNRCKCQNKHCGCVEDVYLCFCPLSNGFCLHVCACV
jgi:hypothetical protein